MKKYLIWVNLGCETGSPQRIQSFYEICEGHTEEEAIDKWLDQTGLSKSGDISIRNYEDGWYCDGRKLNVFHLIENNGYENWKTLEWK